MYEEENFICQSGYVCVRCGNLFPGVLDDSQEEKDCFRAVMPPGVTEVFGLICAECAGEAFVEAPGNPGGIEYIPVGFSFIEQYQLLYEPYEPTGPEPEEEYD